MCQTNPEKPEWGFVSQTCMGHCVVWVSSILFYLGVWRCAGMFLWNTAGTKPVGFQTTWIQHGLKQKHWASLSGDLAFVPFLTLPEDSETILHGHSSSFLLHPCHGSLGVQYPACLIGCGLGHVISFGQSKVDMLVCKWQAKAQRALTAHCFSAFVSTMGRICPGRLLKPPEETSLTGLVANLYACEQETNFYWCKSEFCGCLTLGIIAAISDWYKNLEIP